LSSKQKENRRATEVAAMPSAAAEVTRLEAKQEELKRNHKKHAPVSTRLPPDVHPNIVAPMHTEA